MAASLRLQSGHIFAELLERLAISSSGVILSLLSSTLTHQTLFPVWTCAILRELCFFTSLDDERLIEGLFDAAHSELHKHNSCLCNLQNGICTRFYAATCDIQLLAAWQLSHPLSVICQEPCHDCSDTKYAVCLEP